MKTGLSILGIVCLIMIVFGVYMCNALKSTTWGGWTPPESELRTELTLSEEEKKWRKRTEADHACRFTYMGVGAGQDSTIYMQLFVNEHSVLQQQLCDSAGTVAEKLSKSFAGISNPERLYGYIEFSFRNLLFDISGNRLKRPVTIKCLYHIPEERVIWLWNE
jgi:hypothetical protein